MSKIRNTRFGKVVSVALGFATALTLTAGVLTSPQTASALTTEETIAQLLAQITQLQAQLATEQSSGGGATTAKCSFTRSLTIGSQGEDVTCLQDYLKGTSHYTFSGGSTGYFGPVTRTAIAAWQSANGISPAVGYFGPVSQAKYDSLVANVVVTTPTTTTYPAGCTSATGFSTTTGQSCAVTTTTTYPAGCTSATGFSQTTGQSCSGTVTTVPTGTGLAIASATQPAATLAPQGAARVSFTKFTLTAGSEDVTVTGINVERTNLGSDSNFSGIVLLDETGTQLGLEKTLNSNHQATVGDTFTVKAGTSKTLTIAGNMAADNSTRAGQVVALTVNGVNTSATVSGTLPITGAVHTINSSLSIGSVPTLANGSISPGSDQSKEVGTTGYTFTSVKLTAGSAEKVRFNSIRWNQSGSAATSDIENVKTYVDGVAYDTTVSSDGKYYTSTFGSGIVVDKGGNVEISVKGDVVSGSGRTIDFDIYKRTDVNVVGETYLYGITPANGASAAAADSGSFSSSNPWYDAYQVTVSTGSLTVTKATSVAAQNISISVADQPLGGFEVEAKGEDITVASMVFSVASSSGSGSGLLTNVSLVDENGSIVAGPVDAVSTGATTQSVTFTDSVTFATGKKTYTLKGKVASTVGINTEYVVSTTPSTNWTSVTGQTTGNSITPSSAVVTGNTMTVKTATLTISVSASPAAQTVVAGAQGFTFANYVFDATASGENVRFSSFPLAYEAYGGTATNLNTCALYDGSTQLNTGSNVINPSAAGSSTNFTLDSSLTLTKGTTKTLSLKCNIIAGATGSYAWGYDSGASPTVTGVTSGQSASLTENDSTGQKMTLTTVGTLTVEADDSSSPSYGLVAANTTATIGVFKFTATNEEIKLTKLGLKLTNTASTSASDFTSSGTNVAHVTLWDGSTQVGSAIFTGTTATSTLTADFIIPKDGTKTLTMKADLAKIGTNETGRNGAVVAIDYIGAGNAQGAGASSGSVITSTSGATAFAGSRMFRSYPTFAKVSGTATTIASTQTDVELYRFSVNAQPTGANGIGLYTVNVNVATSTGSAVSGTTTVTNLKLFAYTDSGLSSPVTGSSFLTGGQVANTVAGLVSGGDNIVTFLAPLQISSGATNYFVVKGDITFTAGSGTLTGSVTTKISTDTAYPSLATTLMGTVSGISSSKVIWSPNATTTSSITHEDWTNGYGVSGLTNIGQVTISK